MKKEKTVVISMSGGKDSTAMRLLAIERGIEHVAVFADTGNEHEETYKYLDYLRETTGPIKTVKADFSEQIERKKTVVQVKWRKDGVPEETIQKVLPLLVPTGNPFLDLCIWKGRFPSTKARFCTQELKIFPMMEQVMIPLLNDGEIESWQGVRADESLARRDLPERQDEGGGYHIYRPILTWNVEQVFAQHKKHGIKPNPLYKQGMGRVGCMPCVNCRKNELKEIANRFPEVIERLREWEQITSAASKWGEATFFPAQAKKGIVNPNRIDHGIDYAVAWSRTKRGGRETDMFSFPEFTESCSSAYGLCE